MAGRVAGHFGSAFSASRSRVAAWVPVCRPVASGGAPKVVKVVVMKSW
jgi:hypothetical protein